MHVFRASTALADGITKYAHASSPTTFTIFDWLHSFKTFDMVGTRNANASSALKMTQKGKGRRRLKVEKYEY